MNVCSFLWPGIKFLFVLCVLRFFRIHTCIELVLLPVIISWWWKDTCCYTHERIWCLGEQPPKRLVAVQHCDPPVCQPVRFPLCGCLPVGSTQSPKRDSNPQSHQASRPKPTPQTARPPGSAFSLIVCLTELQLVWVLCNTNWLIVYCV